MLTAEADLDIGATPHWLIFGLEGGRYALPLKAVERVVRAAHVTALPRAPEIVLGVIDLAGRVLPVFDLRRRFGLPARDVDPADQFVIAHTASRAVVLPIDAAQAVIEHSSRAASEAAAALPDLAHIGGVIQLEDGLVLIHDLERFLSAPEARALDEAMRHEAAHAG